MQRQQGRGNRGTKTNDRVLRQPGTFRKTRRISSLLKRIHMVSDNIKRSVLFGLIHN